MFYVHAVLMHEHVFLFGQWQFWIMGVTVIWSHNVSTTNHRKWISAEMTHNHISH